MLAGRENRGWKERALADRLGMSARTLQAWRQKGRGPKWVKLGSSVRYLEQSVEDWLKERERSR